MTPSYHPKSLYDFIFCLCLQYKKRTIFRYGCRGLISAFSLPPKCGHTHVSQTATLKSNPHISLFKMQNGYALTHIFSLHQIAMFPDHWYRSNSHFHKDGEKLWLMAPLG